MILWFVASLVDTSANVITRPVVFLLSLSKQVHTFPGFLVAVTPKDWVLNCICLTLQLTKNTQRQIFLKKIHSFIYVKFCHSTTSLLSFSIFCISERSRSLKDMLFHSTVYSAVNKPRLWHNQAIADGHKTFVQGTPETPWALSSSAILLLQKEAKINRQMTVE